MLACRIKFPFLEQLSRANFRATGLLCCLTAQAPPPSFLQENAIMHMPSDVAVTPDGTVAIARASEAGPSISQPDGITAWDMLTGSRLPISGTPSDFGLGENQGFLMTNTPGGSVIRYFSDQVQATNSRAVAIGSQRSAAGPIDDTTFVDFVKIDHPTATAPPAISHVFHWTITGTPNSPTGRAGHAHDVAVTPNGSIAVVSHRNWTHIFSMNTGRLLLAENIGADPIQWPQQGGLVFTECSPDLAVDSVACTDTRAVVITTKRNGIQSLIVAYVYDLTTLPPVKLAGIAIDANASNGLMSGQAHDLAITPDGTRVVVTGNLSAALIDLTSNPPAMVGPAHQTLADFRTYNINADTVEVTQDRAVITSSEHLGGSYHWKIEIFDTQIGNQFALLATYRDAFPVNSDDDPHDLTITPNFARALVRTTTSIVLIPSLTIPPAQATVFPSAANPLGGFTSTHNAKSFVSDSIVSTNLVAVAIGTFVGSSTDLAVVEFVDLTAGTLVHTETIGVAQTVHAADLQLTPDGTRVVVRCSDLPALGGSTLDFNFFSCVAPIGSPIALGAFGATGNAFGVDSMVIGTTSLIGISEVRTAFNGQGLVQVIKL